MGKTLTWLHLSDIHFHPKTEWRDSDSRTALLDHLTNIFAGDSSLRPDLVFCTGDIAFGETKSAPLSDQYVQAKTFFENLLVVCGKIGEPLPKGRLFIVPGNHDVNRSAINTDAQSTLTNWAKSSSDHIGVINQRFNDRTMEFKDSIKRLDEYALFVKDFLPHQYDIDGRHRYAKTCNINGIKVGIAGFNSAWTCAGPEDDRNIWLAANWQFNKAHDALKNTDLRIGLMHHPIESLNASDRDIATRRLASDYHFLLHGHSHNAWITPIQSHIVIAAGAIGTPSSDEFGINLTSVDLNELQGISHLHNKRAGSNGWTIAPVEGHAPHGQWAFELPNSLRKIFAESVPATKAKEAAKPAIAINDKTINFDFIDRYLTQKLDAALRAFSKQPKVWITPNLCRKSELSPDAKSEPRADLSDLVSNPKNTIVKAPPQYGQTCLANFLVREAWRSSERSLWLYLDAKELKPHSSSINEAVLNECKLLGCTEQDIKGVVIDSWSETEKDAFKLLKNLCLHFANVPIICMQQVDIGLFNQIEKTDLGRQFEVLYLWALSRGDIRKIVAACNDINHIGDEDAVTKRLTSDLEVLNLHRTALNCLTLLKVSEIDFDESPVNRSEMIKRVLFLLFNVDDIPTYKSRPDLKDCEYVLGYFCELLIRDGIYAFTRDKFLLDTQRCCHNSLIDLETQVVFDVLFDNNILIKRGNFFHFKFAYWIFYFAAQRMHHEPTFADYIFEDMRYAQHPELIEFYTGIDRRRDDALKVLIRDLGACSESIKSKCGLPVGLNPYQFATWKPSPEAEAQIQQIVTEGVLESTLPASIKDQYADSTYDQTRPYDQNIASFLADQSFLSMMKTIKAGSRALRNSDYVHPDIKRQLLGEILNCWEQASKVLFVVLPILAEKGSAEYDGTGFILAGNFGDTPKQRFIKILCEIPSNVVSWFEDDLFSRKMGPLLIDQLSDSKESNGLSDICRHELILLFIRQRPRDWSKHVQRYITANKKNSYYLADVFKTLRNQYQFSYASPQALRDMEHLIKLTAAKHATGDKEPTAKAINKVMKANEDLIPPREVN